MSTGTAKRNYNRILIYLALFGRTSDLHWIMVRRTGDAFATGWVERPLIERAQTVSPPQQTLCHICPPLNEPIICCSFAGGSIATYFATTSTSWQTKNRVSQSPMQCILYMLHTHVTYSCLYDCEFCERKEYVKICCVLSLNRDSDIQNVLAPGSDWNILYGWSMSAVQDTFVANRWHCGVRSRSTFRWNK